MARFLSSVICVACLVHCISLSFSQTVVTTNDFPLEMKSRKSESLDEYGEIAGLESFNRPEGTVALPVPATGKIQTGITSGKYGSYRKEKGWINAVSQDVQRHQVLHRNMKTTYPWLYSSMHRPSLVGFGMDGFWNSYAPSTQNAASLMYNHALMTGGVPKLKRI